VRVRVAVGANAADGRDALMGFLRASQGDLVALTDRQGADVAFGDTARGDETVAALYGNIAIAIERTRDAASETPEAWRILMSVRTALGADGSPGSGSMSLAESGSHIAIHGGPFEHVEAVVQGGHVHGAPSPAGVDVVADRPGAVDVRVVASDAFGRTSVATITLTTLSPAH
jgi:hypothetical protein